MGISAKNVHNFDVIVLAAGKGTRMKSDLPKVLHPALGWTMLRFVAEAARKSACKRIFFVLGHGREAVEAEIRSWNWPRSAPELEIAMQAEQKGTGDAVRAGFQAMGGASDHPILILSGDTPLLTEESLGALMEQHRCSAAEITVGAMQPASPKGYGRIVGSAGKVERIVEEKEASAAEREISLVNGGLYAVNPQILAEFLPKLQPNNAAKEFYFTDIIGLANAAGKKVCYSELPAKELEGVNDLLQLSNAANELRRRRSVSLLQAGVQIVDHRHVYIDQDAEIAAGAKLEPHVFIYGRTRIAAGAVVESGARLSNVELHAHARVKAYSCLEDCSVGSKASVGPMAHIRPGSKIGVGAKIGNFVELKKAEIGEASKVSHLSYVGDATVGKDSNIGCGFITCNYDGLEKHRTTIGERVFIGSDVQAIAPITIGDDAYVASGTTLTKDVPATGDLVIARARQENKTGYAKRLLAMKKSELGRKQK